MSTRPSTTKRIENAFGYRPQTKEEQSRHATIKASCEHLSHVLADLCPDSRELNKSLQHIEAACMWASASIARQPAPETPA